MPAEQFTNGATTTLASAISNSATTLTVASALDFPPTPQFRIRIGGELLLVTAVSGDTFTVDRGVESTGADAHAAGAGVRQVLTAGALEALVAGAGTVTSVDVSGGSTGLTASGGPVTGGGTITLGGTLAVGSGGTGAVTAGAARAALGLQIGADVQAYSGTLGALAAATGDGIVAARLSTGAAYTRAITAPAAGITVANGDGVAGNPTLALADDLAALEAMSGTGLVARTATNTYAQRTVTAGSLVTVGDGNGVSGNPTVAVNITGATANTSPVDADEIPHYQVSSTSNKKLTVGNLRKLVTPPGTITQFGGSSVPSGWLECDGSAVSRTTHADLYAAVGTTFGGGDGSTTFNVPDFRRRAPVGKGGTATAGPANTTGSTGGAETHTLTTAQMPAHSHTAPAGNFLIDGGGGANVGGGAVVNIATNTANAGGGTAHNNMQPSLVVMFLIKT